MIVQEMETGSEPNLRAREEWERKKKRFAIAAQVARLEEDDESVEWFEREYLTAHAMNKEACRSMKARTRRDWTE